MNTYQRHLQTCAACRERDRKERAADRMARHRDKGPRPRLNRAALAFVVLFREHVY